MNLRSLTHAVFLLCHLFLCTAVGVARAEEIQLGVAPSNPAKAGFSVFVLTERLGNEGFQPITLRFRAIGKSFNRQRELRVQFRPRTQYTTQVDFQYSVDVTVPQGVPTHDVKILVPHFYRWETCSVSIYEDGRRLGKIPSKLAMPATVQDWGQYMSVGVMVPRDAKKVKDAWARFPDLRSFVTVLGDGPITEKPELVRLDEKQSRRFAETLLAGWSKFRIIDEDSLQSNWIGYSQLDLILAPYPLLRRIETEQPARLAEIQRWVSTGGQLWVYAAPKPPKSAKGANASTSDTDASDASAETPDDPSPNEVSEESTESSWLYGASVDPNGVIRYVNNPGSTLMLGEINDTSPIQYQPWNYGSYSSGAYMYGATEKTRKSVYDNLVSAKHPMIKKQPRKQLVAGLGMMNYGLGRVVLIHQDDPFPGSFQFWQALEMEKQTWSERNGVEYSTGNDSYWAWLMSAVGQPPVTMFVVLNGLFVLVMGPVLYFTLRRRSRLYLLYFLAPTLAFIVTMGLFMYAFISDGFDNRARIRQLTWIDGRHAASEKTTDGKETYPVVDQSRQTYYTVLDNQRGLRFDGDTFVLPVFHTELMNNYSYYIADDRRPGDYLINQDGENRVYAGDFLPTRTQVHYLATRPSTGTFPISVTLVDGAPVLTNELSTPLKTVGYRDDNGKYWIGNDVAPGGKATLNSVRTNVLAAIALEVVDPDSSDLPVPYLNRVSMHDRTGVESRILKFSRSPPVRSVLAVTEVESDQFALRECVPEDCVRVIGGPLP